MKLPVILERDETGMIVAECPGIPGYVSQGASEDEALANIKEAIVACLEVRAQQGLPLTVRTVEIDKAASNLRRHRVSLEEAITAGRPGCPHSPRSL